MPQYLFMLTIFCIIHNSKLSSVKNQIIIFKYLDLSMLIHFLPLILKKSNHVQTDINNLIEYMCLIHRFFKPWK